MEGVLDEYAAQLDPPTDEQRDTLHRVMAVRPELFLAFVRKTPEFSLAGWVEDSDPLLLVRAIGYSPTALAKVCNANRGVGGEVVEELVAQTRETGLEFHKNTVYGQLLDVCPFDDVVRLTRSMIVRDQTQVLDWFRAVLYDQRRLKHDPHLAKTDGHVTVLTCARVLATLVRPVRLEDLRRGRGHVFWVAVAAFQLATASLFQVAFFAVDVTDELHDWTRGELQRLCTDPNVAQLVHKFLQWTEPLPEYDDNMLLEVVLYGLFQQHYTVEGAHALPINPLLLVLMQTFSRCTTDTVCGCAASLLNKIYADHPQVRILMPQTEIDALAWRACTTTHVQHLNAYVELARRQSSDQLERFQALLYYDEFGASIVELVEIWLNWRGATSTVKCESIGELVKFFRDLDYPLNKDALWGKLANVLVMAFQKYPEALALHEDVVDAVRHGVGNAGFLDTLKTGLGARALDTSSDLAELVGPPALSVDLPDEFYDALTSLRMRSPVKLPGSATMVVDRSTVAKLAQQDLDDGVRGRIHPLTRELFRDEDVVALRTLKQRIEEWGDG